MGGGEGGGLGLGPISDFSVCLIVASLLYFIKQFLPTYFGCISFDSPVLIVVQ